MVTATAAQDNTFSNQLTNDPHINQCLEVVTTALLDTKAKQITTMNVTHVTDVTDCVVIANGTSNRHVRALASSVASEAKKAGFTPIGVEGEEDGEWVLVDLADVVVHIMLPKARQFYDLEGLWLNPEQHNEADSELQAVS